MPRQAFLFIISRKARGYPTPSRPERPFVALNPTLVFPSLPFLCLPERQRGVPRRLHALAGHGGRLSSRAKARGLLRDAVPNEVRDASLSLGRTGWRGMTGWRMSPRTKARGPSVLTHLEISRCDTV
jgi:hypothetical protein